MSNKQIILEWLRDSSVAVLLFLFACAVAGAGDSVTPFDYPNLYGFWFLIGMIPFCIFANLRRVGRPITWSALWYVLPLVAILALVPRQASSIATLAVIFIGGAIGSYAGSTALVEETERERNEE